MSSVVVSVSLHRLLALQSDQAFNVVRVLKCSFGNSAGCLSAFVGFKCYLAQLSSGWASLDGSSYPFAQSSVNTDGCLSTIAISLCLTSRVDGESKLLVSVRDRVWPTAVPWSAPLSLLGTNHQGLLAFSLLCSSFGAYAFVPLLEGTE